jgi:hypothetical protein
VSYILTTRCHLHGNRLEHCRACLQAGRTLFHHFHRFPAPGVVRMPCRRVIPKVLVQLGHLRGLIYSSDKGGHGRLKTYIHFMKTPPRLVCDPQGTQLYIVGGRYRVTPRGIEG